MQTLVATPHTTAPTMADTAPATVGPDDIRIRVTAAAVNPVDVFLSTPAGRETFGLDAPIGLGWDVSGVVTERGRDVAGFEIGDAVAALHTDVTAPARTHAEQVVVPAAATAPLPEHLDPVAAASVPLNALTAAQALDLLGRPEGRRLLVTGAAGAVGGYAVTLATRAGWKVTGLARPFDRGFVLRAGADELVTDLPGSSYDAVLDAAVLHEVALGALREGGAFVGVQPGWQAPDDRRDATVEAVNVTADGARLTELLALHASGVLPARVAGQVALAEAATAYDKVAGGGQRGRWLLIP